MMATTDTHNKCNRQAGLNFMGVRPVLDLVASDESSRGLGMGHGGWVRYIYMRPTTNRHFITETLNPVLDPVYTLQNFQLLLVR